MQYFKIENEFTAYFIAKIMQYYFCLQIFTFDSTVLFSVVAGGQSQIWHQPFLAWGLFYGVSEANTAKQT
jgi:hypothetical protein